MRLDGVSRSADNMPRSVMRVRIAGVFKYLAGCGKTRFVCLDRPVLSQSKGSARTENSRIFNGPFVRPEALEGPVLS
jgi:hypothetical protein